MKIVAQILSYVFHPLIIPTYMVLLLLLINPYLFGVNSLHQGFLIILRIFFTTFLIPSVAVLIMKGVGLISSLEMEERTDRVGPFIATGVFYLWAFRSLLADTSVPSAYLVAVLGATIVLFVCFFINIFYKLSVHAAGMAGFLGMVLICMHLYSVGIFKMDVPFLGECIISMNFILVASILAAAAVMSARLILNVHSLGQITLGFTVGLLGQFIALKILI